MISSSILIIRNEQMQVFYLASVAINFNKSATDSFRKVNCKNLNKKKSSHKVAILGLQEEDDHKIDFRETLVPLKIRL